MLLRQTVYTLSEPHMESVLSDRPNIASPMHINSLKRSLTLNLNHSGAKRTKLTDNPSPPILSTPDLMMLKVGTPELERMLLDQQNVLVTTVDNVFFPGNLSEEQEYPTGLFMEPLHTLTNDDPSQGTNWKVSCRNNGVSQDPQYQTNCSLYTSPDKAVVIKDEPQCVPDILPPLSPIDMKSQEIIKLERKRQRNRVAATRCRRRKLEKISHLEDRVQVLKSENAEMAQVVKRLKNEVYYLKQKIIEHERCGCCVPLTFENV